MEFSNTKISLNHHNPFKTPLLSPKISIFTLKNTSSRLTISTSRKLHLQTSFSLYSNRKSHISAHFSRPTKRPNYLRRKLTQHQQVKQVNEFQNPLLEFDNFNVSESNIDTNIVESENLAKSFSLDDNYDGFSDSVKELEIELPKNKFGDSVMWNKLESWVEQYKKDSEFWGVGNGPIFIIVQDSECKIEKVEVNEDEIVRRSRVDPRLDSESDEMAEASYKIMFAKDLARDIESGSNVIPKNSTVVKILSSGEVSRFADSNQVVKFKPGLFSRMSRAGLLLLCGVFIVRAVRRLFAVGEDKKVKKMTEEEKIVKGDVEVVEDPVGSTRLSTERPRLNKEELVNKIKQIKGPNDGRVVEYSGYKNKEFEYKIEEITAMARNVREIEKRNSSKDVELENEHTLKESPNGNANPEIGLLRVAMLVGGSEEITESKSTTKPVNDIGLFSEELVEKNDTQIFSAHNGNASSIAEVGDMNSIHKSSVLSEPKVNSDGQAENSPRKRVRIMKSVEEAREYLSRKHEKSVVNEESELKNGRNEIPVIMPIENVASVKRVKPVEEAREYLSRKHEKSVVNEESEIKNGRNEIPVILPIENVTSIKGDVLGVKDQENLDSPNNLKISNEKHNSEDNKRLAGGQSHGANDGNEANAKNAEQESSVTKENWIEKNFHEFEPIVERIRDGFRDKYYVGREKAKQELDSKVDLMQLKSDTDEGEFEWMKDEKLREIVFRVRDNELSGRDPFHLMHEEDKRAFFRGLEKKVEQENEKLQSLHEYFHSNIENLDYGADGISIYDPPEKIIPRWKEPPVEKNPEFLNNFLEQRKSLIAKGLENSFSTKKTGTGVVNKPEPLLDENANLAATVSNQSMKCQEKTSPKIVIEASDGSVKAGKKSGKEFWQHTKKWSQGFLESYNAENDPEVKSVMKDVGKDLDRWITEKEVQEAAELMDKLPEKGKKFVKEKLDKVKREMELFGPQAVVSKYREYVDDKEEDYLWWLDLPCVLCIELYTVENGEQRVGFYSLEMATDLELDPKQYHVIAFEDAGDCKNLCYIIQAHMELLGNGYAFVVARPPKDTFREAKENGFNVTVIRKGEMRLNIDQTLEEVEELIEEIGSKIYHDKLMKERSMDINALMKGVFGISKPVKRKKRSRRKLRKGNKP